MTLAARARAHHLWSSYVEARAQRDYLIARELSQAIAMDLGLTERQRVNLLPMIARRTKPRGRPRTRTVGTRCPYCAHELEIVLP